ncbi:MAG: matrixin family metalloprotease [Ardenticatenales bacterium]|nr:matrixin family metalloprotease [Ardenticatenales bacterium]
MCLHRKVSIILAIAVMFVVMSSFSTNTLAYQSGPRWQQTNDVFYYVHPQINTLLRLPANAPPVADLIQQTSIQWSKASEARLIRSNNAYNESFATTISATNYQTLPPCGPLPIDQSLIAAAVCLVAADGSIFSTKTYFNTSPSWSWNTNSFMDCNSNPRNVDVSAIVLHEFGHWLNLGHNAPPAAVMSPHCGNPAEAILDEDDRRGATQLYGPRTSFETGEAQGIGNELAYSKDVSGYIVGVPPELGVRAAENWIPIEFGSRYLMMAGKSNNNYSYAYFRWFSSTKDTNNL